MAKNSGKLTDIKAYAELNLDKSKIIEII